MLKVLLKKQMAEVFRSYFYNPKTNQARSEAGKILMFVLFGFLMVVVLGGTFTFVAIGTCAGLAMAGMSWLYFALMGGIAILLGAFGSVFNTYSGLYLPKDNDLLLSMPIPVRIIIISRLLNVYLLGAMYSGIVLIPTLAVYWVIMGVTAARLICGLLFLIIITLIVLILSCLLGWVVAKVSLKIKNKSFITVLISLLFIAGYYFVYFKAQDVIKDLIANAEVYGANIKNSAYVLYLFGRVGEGDFLATAIFTAATAAVLALVMFILSRGFLKLATSSAAAPKIKYKEKRSRMRSPFAALLTKELKRFTSSPAYMLNCGLGVILIPALGIFLIFKGADILSLLDSAVMTIPGLSGMIVCAVLMLLATMIDTAAPSVSLEGKSIWIPQSLPVSPKSVLMAKAVTQLILTEVPMLFTGICAAVIVRASVAEKVLIVLLPVVFALFMALFGVFLGVKNPILNWSSEIVPLKQGGAVLIAVFGGWGCVLVIGLPYLPVGSFTGLVPYLAFWVAVLAGLSFLLYRWLCTRGAKAFSEL